MIMGVVPTKLEEHGRVSDLLDVTFHSVNLSDRKDIMSQESDVMVALPGGIGTLDEVFHVMAACSIGYHQKKSSFIMWKVSGMTCWLFEPAGGNAFCTPSVEKLF